MVDHDIDTNYNQYMNMFYKNILFKNCTKQTAIHSDLMQCNVRDKLIRGLSCSLETNRMVDVRLELPESMALRNSVHSIQPLQATNVEWFHEELKDKISYNRYQPRTNTIDLPDGVECNILYHYYCDTLHVKCTKS